MGSKRPSKRAVQFLFTSPHTVPTSIPSSNYSPNSRRSCAKLPHILSRMPHSPLGASARPSPRVSIKSLVLNALHTSQIQDMVHLNGNRSSPAGTPHQAALHPNLLPALEPDRAVMGPDAQKRHAQQVLRNLRPIRRCDARFPRSEERRVGTAR